MASEETKVIEAENSTEVLTAFSRIPYALINAEVSGSAKDTLDELTQICSYYKVYKKGANFNVEGTNGDYIPARLKYKMAASLINKEARFLFAVPPDITVEPKGDVGKITQDAKDALTIMNDLVKTILDANKFEDALIKAAKDCFIGKRVAGLINFNEEDGVTVTFLPATQFIYETKIGNPNVLTKFVCFQVIKSSMTLTEKRIFKKKFVLDETDKKVYLEEAMYDGVGKLLEQITEYQETLMPMIPAVIFINDGLTGEDEGESEIEILEDDESWYSKLSCADIDAQRKSMNPTKYTVDMDSNSTKNLSTAAGAFWDLGSDQNLDKPSPAVGLLEPAMNYSTALDMTLKRVKKSAYEQVDMPDIEAVQATITSGKALKAIYWPLIIRCQEKMKMWGPQLRALVNIIIQGAMVYPNCIVNYIDGAISPVAYEISVEQNTPLPEDEVEERNMDLAEVESKAMSRKAYMKKWRRLTDDEVMEELEQIALERQLIEDASFSATGDTPPYPTSGAKEGIEVEEEELETETPEDEEIIEEEEEVIE